MTNVCFQCRYRPGVGEHEYGQKCPNGHVMQYVHVHLPRSRDDHKMWKLAEEKTTARRRPRRSKRQWGAIKRANTRGLQSWERELLKASR